MANILDWSFQQALDEVASTYLGTRWVGPKTTPVLDAASRMAIEHRGVCEDVFKALARTGGVDEKTRRDARSQVLAASRRVLALAERRKEIEELRLFHDVEDKQRDSKLFWARFKSLRNSICVAKSPPPVAIDKDGNTVFFTGFCH